MAENSPASSVTEKRLATLEKRLGKRLGRRNAALGSVSEANQGAAALHTECRDSTRH